MGSVNNFLHKIAKQRALAESYKTDESGNAWSSVEAYIEKLKSKGIPLLDNVSVLVNVNGTVQEMTNKGQTDIHSFIPKGTDDTTVTTDATPTANSTNPVQSGGVKSYVDSKIGDINTILESL